MKIALKRILTLLLAVIMLGSCTFCLILPATAAEVSVQNGTGSRSPVGAGQKYYAYRAKVNGEFTAFSMAMPTWMATDAACTLALFRWTGNPDDSVAGEPIATKRFDPMVDCARNQLTFDPQPAGEYLFAVIEPRGAVGIWSNVECTDQLGYVYIDGREKSYQPEMEITFTQEIAEPFGQCEPLEYIDGTHKSPAEYEIPDDSLIKTHEVMPDTWVFTDGLGRVSLTNAEVGDPRDKTVSMFFWTWHLGRTTARNINEMSENHPDAILDPDHPVWKEYPYAGSWNESIYGFYDSTDQWVLRRQAELLANAGVDAILTDNTNETFTHRDGYTALFESWSDAMDDGVLTPKVSFMMPFYSSDNANTQVRELYKDFYRWDNYQKLWFYWDDKPVMMAHKSAMVARDEVGKEIAGFFTFRPGVPNYLSNQSLFGQWGWLSIYPQAEYYAKAKDMKDGIPEQMTVGVAQNYNYKENCLSPMSGHNVMGRSYTHDNPTRYEDEGKEASKWGYNFAEQFNYAIEKDPEMIFVTGWNEWAMAIIPNWGDIPIAFFDQFNDEYSRDIEPTKGELKDHYYYQLVNFVRQYKGARPIPTPSQQTTVDITKDNTQWNNVAPYYAAYIGNTDDREGEGWGDVVYHEYSGRNDIIGARVARDADNLYFYVECNEDITPYTDPLWMVLYIDSDQQNQGWETFDYVLNKTSPTADKATLERFTGNGYETEVVGEVAYTVNGKYMQVEVPKSMLNLSGYDFTVNFAWTDNVHDEDDTGEWGDTEYKYTRFSGDIMDFYISGDVAPSGRFKFSYISTNENALGQTEETETETTAVETTESITETAAETDAAKGGCASVLSGSCVLLLASMAAAVAFKKREDA